jgi:hypothetical protein
MTTLCRLPARVFLVEDIPEHSLAVTVLRQMLAEISEIIATGRAERH